MRKFFPLLLIILFFLVFTFAFRDGTKIKALDIPTFHLSSWEELEVDLREYVSGLEKAVRFQLKKGKGEVIGDVYRFTPDSGESAKELVEIWVSSGSNEAVLTLDIEVQPEEKALSIKLENQKIYEGSTLELKLSDFTTWGSNGVFYELVSGVGSVENGFYRYTALPREAPVAHRVTLKAIEGEKWDCATFSIIVMNLNNRPQPPCDPHPDSGIVDFFRGATLTWKCGDPDGDALRYDLYFGQEADELELLASNLERPEYTVPTLEEGGVRYFWKVVAKDVEGGETDGEVWDFTLSRLREIKWRRVLGGSGKDSITTARALESGGFIFAGFSESVEIQKNHSSGKLFRDGWLVKLDDKGYLAWQKTFDFDWTQFNDVVQTDDKGYLLVGSVLSADPSTGERLSKLLITKLDLYANLSWKVELPGTVNEAVSLSKTEGGFLVLATKNGEESQRGDIALIKIDNKGNILWERTYGGPASHERAVDMTPSGDGGVVIVAETTSKGSNPATSEDRIAKINGIPIETSSVMVVRVDSRGTLLWSKVFSGNGEDSPAAVLVNDEAEILICGSTSSSDGDFSGTGNDYDAFLLKLTKEGTVLWKKRYGGEGNDGSADMTLTPSGGAMIVGFTESDDSELGNFHSGELDKLGLTNSDFWVFQVDNRGGLLWSECVGGRLGDVGTAISSGKQGYVIAGYTASNDGDVPANRGDFDAFIFLLH